MENEPTEQEITAKANQKKINIFITGIGFRLVILMTVVYASFNDNEYAEWLLYIIAGFCLIALIAGSIILILPLKTVAKRDLTEKSKEVYTSPTRSTVRGIAAFCTVIATPILITHGFYVVAAIFALSEIVQFFTVRKMKIIVNIDNAAVNMAARIINDLDAAVNSGAIEFTKVIETMQRIEQINEKIDELQKEIDAEPAGSTNREILETKCEKLMEEGSDLLVNLENVGKNKD